MLGILGNIYKRIGDYEKALDYFERSLKISEEIGDKREIVRHLKNIGIYYFDKRDFEKAKKYLEKSHALAKESERGEYFMLSNTAYLYLTYKIIGKTYDEKIIHVLIKEFEIESKGFGNIEYYLNYRLSQLLEDTSYLETAYNQVQELANTMGDGAKFLSYPIPKAIVEEWEKVK